MGFLANRRARHEEEARRQKLAELGQRREHIASLLEWSREFDGVTDVDGLVLKPGERAFKIVQGASLVEDRARAAHWEGRSAGVSIPIGHIGRSPIRWRVGKSSGHIVAATPVATAIDTGNLYVTDRRIVFAGSRQTRECLFDKLLSFQFEDGGGVVLSVSNRQKATTILWGPDAKDEVHAAILLALAHYRQDVPTLLTQLQEQLDEVDADVAGMTTAMPPPPAGPRPPEPLPPPPPPLSPPPSMTRA
jgi:hypothetical protein